MELHDRLEKVATGISVSDAIDAYMQELEHHRELDAEQARSLELAAIVEIMFLMAAVDGEVADLELKKLRASLDALPDMRAVASLDLDALLVELAETLGREGWKRRLEAAGVAIETPDAKRFAFRLAAGIAFVDDFVAHAEAAALDALALALGLERAESQAILREVHRTLFGGSSE